MEMILSEDECRSVLRRALGRTDFIIQKMEEKSATDSSLGFMARHLRIVVSVSVDGASRDVSMFVKAPPSYQSYNRLLEEWRHFQKEQGMYESVIPLMSEALPDGVHLPVPRCFLTRKADVSGAEEVIVLEDLKEKGYRMWDRMKPFDRAHCLSVLKSLARLHAGSFLVQKAATLAGKGNNLDYMDGKFRVATEWLMVGAAAGETSRQWAATSIETMASAAIGLWPERFGGQRERLLGRLWEAWFKMSEMCKPSGKHTNVVCHGDVWINNLMFRYEGGEPVDAALIDLQLVRYAPPAMDVLMLLHTSTTKAFRTEHMRELVLEYHKHLEEIVGKASLDKLMPLGTLFDCMEEYDLFGKLVSSFWSSCTLKSEEPSASATTGDPVDFVSDIMKDRGEWILTNARGSEVYRERIMETYEECLQLLGLWM